MEKEKCCKMPNTSNTSGVFNSFFTLLHMDQLFVFEKNIEVSEVMIIFRKQMYFVLLFSVDDEYIE